MTVLPKKKANYTNSPLVCRKEIDVVVVRSLDELFAAYAIRARAFMEEQSCPHEEEFDGNDLAGATHLLARRNGEPVGTMRLRYFADFVKSERYAVIRKERKLEAAYALMDAACILAARKGYKKILGHAQIRVVPFWERLGGGKRRAGRPTFNFSGHEYAEVIREVATPNNVLSIDSPPMQLARPEGLWDEPAVLDKSNNSVSQD